MSKLSSLAKSSAVMTAGTFTSRILGFVKAFLLATAIGVTAVQADAFDIANKVPNTLYMLLAGGVLNAVLVPQIVRASKAKDGGKDYTDRLLTLSFLILGIVTVVATIAAPLMVWLYSSGWSPEQLALGTAFAYWCLPQLFFYGLYTLLGQVLNAKENFGPYMWAPVLNNVVAIIGLIAFIVVFGANKTVSHDLGTWTPGMIALLAGTATLGVVSQALILIWPLRTIRFSYRPKFGFRGVGLGTAGKVAGWTFSAMLLGQLGFLIISRVAASASVAGEANASNAAYSYAYLIFMLPHSLVAVSLATALFTSMSKDAADQNTDAVRDSFSTGIRLVGLVNTFATIAFFVLANQVAMLVSNTDDMDQASAIGAVIITMVIGLVPFSANYLAQRVFYAYEDAKTPFFVQIPQIAFTSLAVLSFFYIPKQFTVLAIGAAMSLGYVIAMVLSFWLLRRRLGSIDGQVIISAHLRYLAAGAITMVAGYIGLYLFNGWMDPGRLTAAIEVVVLGTVMLAVYLVLCYLFKVRELHSIIGVVAGKIRR